jgi:hypothetical protein
MSRYRIAPHGADRWKVQKLNWGLIWLNFYEMKGYDYFELVTFKTASEAELFILDELEREAAVRDYAATALRRLRHIHPREFP